MGVVSRRSYRKIRVKAMAVRVALTPPGTPMGSPIFEIIGGGTWRVPTSSDAMRQLTPGLFPLMNRELELTVDERNMVSSVAEVRNGVAKKLYARRVGPTEIPIKRQHAGSITTMMNKANVPCDVDGRTAGVRVSVLPANAPIAQDVLSLHGYRFTETQETWPANRTVFTVVRRVLTRTCSVSKPTKTIYPRVVS